MGEANTQPKKYNKQWFKLVEINHFPPNSQKGSGAKPKKFILNLVEDGTFAISLTDPEGGHIAMALSKAEALEVSAAIKKKADW